MKKLLLFLVLFVGCNLSGCMGNDWINMEKDGISFKAVNDWKMEEWEDGFRFYTEEKDSKDSITYMELNISYKSDLKIDSIDKQMEKTIKEYEDVHTNLDDNNFKVKKIIIDDREATQISFGESLVGEVGFLPSPGEYDTMEGGIRALDVIGIFITDGREHMYCFTFTIYNERDRQYVDEIIESIHFIKDSEKE